jgi:hypothetical protein
VVGTKVVIAVAIKAPLRTPAYKRFQLKCIMSDLFCEQHKNTAAGLPLFLKRLHKKR